MDYHVNPWLDTVVLDGEVEAARWVKQNLDSDPLLIADIFGGELIMGIAAVPTLVGGDWAANPNATKQMGDAHEFFVTDSPEKAVEIWKKYNADYAFFPSREVHTGYGKLPANEEKMNSPYFEVVFENAEVRVYKLSQGT